MYDTYNNVIHCLQMQHNYKCMHVATIAATRYESQQEGAVRMEVEPKQGEVIFIPNVTTTANTQPESQQEGMCTGEIQREDVIVIN